VLAHIAPDLRMFRETSPTILRLPQGEQILCIKEFVTVNGCSSDASIDASHVLNNQRWLDFFLPKVHGYVLPPSPIGPMGAESVEGASWPAEDTMSRQKWSCTHPRTSYV
jgi:hypothetical protein